MRVLICAGLVTIGMASSLTAGIVETSIRPEVRPTPQSQSTGSSETIVLARSLKPAGRPSDDIKEPEAVTISTSNQRFQYWIRAFKRRAINQGIDARVLDQAFEGVGYDPDVIRRDRNQSEFTKTIWEYLDSAASDTRIANGQDALNAHRRTLDAIENKYGVDKEVVVAVWGLESAYGAYRGSTDIVQALSTLAFDGRRGQFFEEQLIAALKILQNGDTSPRNMTGSWAGAMGHTQFIPTSYLAYAVDFTGDGRRDIWSDDPSDALASTAAYLARFGWVKGQPWGVEIILPANFDFTLASRRIEKRPGEWAALGIVGLDGAAVPNHGDASILLPAGGNGAAFMIFKNFSVIERYNTADAYVIGVGHLSDRIKGGPPIQSDWPRGDRALTFAERKEMQKRLTAKGFDTDGIDGRIGPKTISAVRAYQMASGMTPDGYASMNLLKRLR